MVSRAATAIIWFAVISACLGAASSQAGPAEDADFAARCAGPGVVRCVGFDNTTSDIVPNVTTLPGNQGQFPQLDTTVKVSGAGSLRLRIPNSGPAQANMAGAWFGGMGAAFTQNTHFYVQYRFRISPEMVTVESQLSTRVWKWSIFYGRSSNSCSAVELTSETYPESGAFARMYTDCGGRGLYASTNYLWNAGGTGVLVQQGTSAGVGYNCAYPNLNGSTCFRFQPNVWYTLLYDIKLGSWGAPNSVIKAYVAAQGATSYTQWIHIDNMALSFQNNPSDTYDTVTFLTYSTGNNVVPTVSADAWYDELIVSTQPIPLPSAGPVTIPSQPMNLIAR